MLLWLWHGTQALHEYETVDGLFGDAVFGAQEALLLNAERNDDGLALKSRSASSDGLPEDLDQGWEGLQCEELLDLVTGVGWQFQLQLVPSYTRLSRMTTYFGIFVVLDRLPTSCAYLEHSAICQTDELLLCIVHHLVSLF